MSSSTTGPLPPLPPEIVLELVDHLPVSALTRLEQCSKAWNAFFDRQHTRIWSQHLPSTAPPSTEQIPTKLADDGWKDAVQARSRDTLDIEVYRDVHNWKDYCKRRTCLLRNWRGQAGAEEPEQIEKERSFSPDGRFARSARRSSASLSAGPAFWRTDPRIRRIREGIFASHSEDSSRSESRPFPDGTGGYYTRCEEDKNELCKLPSIKQTAYSMSEGRLIWRFRPDFTHRLILTTAQHGGIEAIDMDDGEVLWQRDEVLPYAHLEYDKGHAVWNDDGEGLEVWRMTEERGAFEHVTTLDHNHQIRGFHLVYPTLCVVSTDGRGFVYDLSVPPGRMHQRDFPIETDARGHLFQYEDVVMYCYEVKGYHFHAKDTGEHLGILHPAEMASDLPSLEVYHIKHNFPQVSAIPRAFVNEGPHEKYAERIEKAASDTLRSRQHPEVTHIQTGAANLNVPLEEDEWGACSLWYDWMVCISKGGRALLCSDWRGALRSAERAKASTIMIECHNTGMEMHFNFGGWLSVAHGRVMFEIGDWVYIMHLPLNPEDSLDKAAVWCIPGVADASFSTPISFMGLYEDCLMTTYATIRVGAERLNGPRLTHAKTIRVASFVPEMGDEESDQIDNVTVKREGEAQGRVSLKKHQKQPIDGNANHDEDDDEWTDAEETPTRPNEDPLEQPQPPLQPLQLSTHVPQNPVRAFAEPVQGGPAHAMDADAVEDMIQLLNDQLPEDPDARAQFLQALLAGEAGEDDANEGSAGPPGH